MRKALQIALIAAFITSCGDKRKIGETKFEAYESPTLTADTTHSTQELDISTDKSELPQPSQIRNVSLIPLETKDGVAIGAITSIGIIDGKYVVTDGYRAKQIFIFGPDGRFLNKIGKLGKGPGEYQDLSAVNVSDKHIYVTDKYGAKLICYDIDGRVVRETKDPKITFGLNFNEISDSILVGSHYAYHRGSHYSLTYANVELDSVVETALPFENTLPRPAGTITKGTDGLLFSAEYSDYVYLLGEKSIAPILKLNLIDDKALEDHIATVSEMTHSQFYRHLRDYDDPLARNIRVFDCEDRWCVEFSKFGVEYLSVIPKGQSKPELTIKKVDYRNTKFHLPLFNYAANGKRLVAALDQHITDIDSEDFDAFRGLLRPKDSQFIEQYDLSDDNPIIMEYELRQ